MIDSSIRRSRWTAVDLLRPFPAGRMTACRVSVPGIQTILRSLRLPITEAQSRGLFSAVDAKPVKKNWNAEIARLQEAKQLLSGLSGNGLSSGTRRPSVAGGKKRLVLSAEERRRSAEAQRKRWTTQKRLRNSPAPRLEAL